MDRICRNCINYNSGSSICSLNGFVLENDSCRAFKCEPVEGNNVSKVGKYTLQDLADIVELEGLGYAIQSYVSVERIEDDEIRELWSKCQDLMNEIEERLPEGEIE